MVFIIKSIRGSAHNIGLHIGLEIIFCSSIVTSVPQANSTTQIK